MFIIDNVNIKCHWNIKLQTNFRLKEWPTKSTIIGTLVLDKGIRKIFTLALEPSNMNSSKCTSWFILLPVKIYRPISLIKSNMFTLGNSWDGIRVDPGAWSEPGRKHTINQYLRKSINQLSLQNHPQDNDSQ